jgi:hypothetical protein
VKHFATLALLGLLAACGGGGYGSGMTVTNASPGGIWTGTDSISGLAVVGLVDEAGEFHFIRTDGVQYVGQAMVSGNTVSANFDGYTPFGSTFPDNSTHGMGTLSGTVQERSSLSGNTMFVTDANSTSNGTISLTFNALYNSGSSFSAIAGNYTDPATGDTVSVSSAGVIFSQDATTGCVVNGNVSIINAAYDAYAVSYTYGNCIGTAAVLNGVQFSGLGTLDINTNPVQAIIGVNGKSGAVSYAVVLTLNHQ